jgi:transcriptional regulator with XRE-family HTH domain
MPGPDAATFASLLKRQRLAAGLTQEALAERPGLSPRAVSDLERDPARTPRLGTVTLLADALGADQEQRGELLAAASPGVARGTPADGMESPGRVLPRPLLNLGNVAGARAVLEEGLAVNRRYHDRWSLAMSLTMMGHLDLADGGHTRAQALLGEAASQFADTGNLMFVPWCLEGLAGVAAARGDHERAAELDGRATPCAPRSVYCIHLCIRPPTREPWPPLTPALRQQPSTRPAPGQPIRRRSR